MRIHNQLVLMWSNYIHVDHSDLSPLDKLLVRFICLLHI